MKAAFIINPVSGTRSKDKAVSLIEDFAEAEDMQVALMFTEKPGQATELAAKASQEGYDIVVAVGGDGTVNEVAKGIRFTQTSLAIVPHGSGNGLARHFLIPMDMNESLNVIRRNKIKAIDSMEMNGTFVLNMAGAGFDAHVAAMFAKEGTRGFLTYARVSIKEFMSYRQMPYTIELDGKLSEGKAFIIVFANASQWGNNAIIAPGAIPDDGLITVGILKELALSSLPGFAAKLFSGKLSDGNYLSYYQAKSVRLQLSEPFAVHIDGEPAGSLKEIEINIKPLSIRLVVP